MSAACVGFTLAVGCVYSLLFSILFLFFLFLLLLAMAISSDTDLSGDDDSSRADGQLWADLPRQVRKELGGVGGALPASDVIAFSVDSERDARAFAQSFAPGDERAIASFVELWRRAQAKAMQVCRRRARVDPADQFVQVSHKLPRLGGIGLHDNLSWLRKQSGAMLRSTIRDLPRAAASRSGQSRAVREAGVLQKARAELADLLMEAKLPITVQAMSCREPEKIIAAALGGMRASTIRKRIREWRKVRAFALGVAGVPWPPHIGLVLDYMQERLDEPCARTVPISILSALGFMEKAGGVALHDRMANQQTLKNMVNQGVTLNLREAVELSCQLSFGTSSSVLKLLSSPKTELPAQFYSW